MADEKQILIKTGMKEQEAKVYLALLDIGESTATKIAERTGIERVHTYQIANSLIEKGAVSYIVKNGIKHFSASNPNNLLKSLKSKEEELKNILPSLLARAGNSIETKVEVYRGREGINSIFKMILRDNNPYYFLGGIEESCDKFRLENIVFVKRAEKMKLKGKILARKNDNFFIGQNEELRFIPDNIIMTTTTWTWGKKTGIFVWQEPYYCILTESSQIANSNIANFEFLFDKAIKPSKKEISKRLLRI